MNQQPNFYSAEQAANLVLGLSIAAALICGFAGYRMLQAGSGTGYILLGVGFVPLLFAIVLRVRLRKP